MPDNSNTRLLISPQGMQCNAVQGKARQCVAEMLKQGYCELPDGWGAAGPQQGFTSFIKGPNNEPEAVTTNMGSRLIHGQVHVPVIHRMLFILQLTACNH